MPTRSTPEGKKKPFYRPGSTTPTKFKGNCDDLSGSIFDCGDNRTADGFVSTKKRIAEYVGATYDHGADIRSSIENGTKFVIPPPPKPTALVSAAIAATAAVAADPNNNVAAVAAVAAQAAVYEPMDEYQKMEYSGILKNHLYKVSKLDENIKKAYSLILGQCTENLQSRLKQTTQWATFSVSFNSLMLLDSIQSIAFKYEDRKFQPLALHQVKQSFYSFNQGNLSNSEYLQQFKNRSEMAESHGTDLTDRAVAVMLMKQNPVDAAKNFETGLSDAERKLYLDAAGDLCQAVAFLVQSDKRRYGELLSDLENDYTKGLSNYPKSLTKAYQYLNDYKIKTSVRDAGNNEKTNEVAFVQEKENDVAKNMSPG